MPRGSRITNSVFHRMQVRWKGTRDGKHGIPHADDRDSSNYEKQLITRGVQHQNAIVGSYSASIQSIEGQREHLIDELGEAVARYEVEVRTYRARRQTLGRDINVHMKKVWYLTFLAMILVGEFALNSQAFDVFGKAVWLTYIMALAVAVGLPVVAHFLGIWIKQWPKPAWQTAVKVAVVNIVTIGCLIGLNLARREYLKAQDVDIGVSDGILERAFLLINLFVFLAATVMSYFSHDEDSELENLHHKVAHLDRRIDKLMIRVRLAGGKCDALATSEHAELAHVRAIITELVHLYRDRNVYARPAVLKPLSFRQEPMIPEASRVAESQKKKPESMVDDLDARRQRALNQDA